MPRKAAPAAVSGGQHQRHTRVAGITQEVYALLITYQALRTAIADTALACHTNPDRLSFTIALHTARDQVIHAASAIAETTIDLIGRIGAAVLAQPLPTRATPQLPLRGQTRHLQTPSQRPDRPHQLHRDRHHHRHPRRLTTARTP
jgi:hypothetical protein